MAGNLAVARDMKMNKYDHCPMTDIQSYNYQEIYNSSDSFFSILCFRSAKLPRECVHAYMSEGVVYDPQTYVVPSSPNYDLRHVAMSP